MSREGHAQEGFALVTALWATLILALLASYIIVTSRTDSRLSRNVANQAKERAAAEGICQLVELQLLGPVAGRIALNGTPFEDSLAGFRGEVTVQDQDGLVDLNSAPAGILRNLFTVVGQLDGTTADSFVDRVLDWRERGIGRRLNGAKASDYAAAGYPYGPRQAPFESVAELKLVLGITQALYERVAPALTIASQKPVINPQVAPAIVLLLLPGFTTESIASLLQARERQHVSGFTPASLPSVAGHAVAIIVTIKGENERSSVTFKAVVRLTDNPATPIWTF